MTQQQDNSPKYALGQPQSIPGMPCPYCKWMVTGIAAFGNKDQVDGKDLKVDPGDLTICVKCANWLIYTTDNLRPITEEEIANMPQEQFDSAIQMGYVIADMRAKKRRDPISVLNYAFGRIK